MWSGISNYRIILRQAGVFLILWFEAACHFVFVIIFMRENVHMFAALPLQLKEFELFNIPVLGAHVFVDIFDSMPDTSFSKTDPAPSADLFSAGTLLHSICHLARALTLISCLAVCVFFSFVLGFDQGRKEGNEIALLWVS